MDDDAVARLAHAFFVVSCSPDPHRAFAYSVRVNSDADLDFWIFVRGGLGFDPRSRRSALTREDPAPSAPSACTVPSWFGVLYHPRLEVEAV